MTESSNNSERAIPVVPDTNSEREVIEKPTAVVDQLLSELDFAPTPELDEAALALVDGLTNPDISVLTLLAAWQEYARISEDAVEKASDYTKAQIAAIIHKAAIFHRTGNDTRYASELDQAEVSAAHAGYQSVSEALRREIDTVIETLEPSPDVLVIKLRGYINAGDREYLRDLIADGADKSIIIDNAYGMIIEEGDDPVEVFRELGLEDKGSFE